MVICMVPCRVSNISMIGAHVGCEHESAMWGAYVYIYIYIYICIMFKRHDAAKEKRQPWGCWC